MDVFDIFIAYVDWEGGGKSRPVLIIGRKEDVLMVFKITTQYEDKSEAIRKNYFKIIDWREAGLKQQSYVDTNSYRNLPKIAWKDKTPTGTLSETDIQRLLKFLTP